MTALQQFWYSRAAIGPTIESSIVGGTITVEALPDDAVAWLWDFGDGTTSTERAPPAHEYETEGPHTVTLTTTYETAGGCSQYQVVSTFSDADVEGPACDPFWGDALFYGPYDADVNDASAYRRVGTKYNQSAVDVTLPKWGSGCLVGDGAGDRVDYQVGTELNLGTGDFTVSLWVRPDDLVNGPYLVSYRLAGGGKGWYINLNTGGLVAWGPSGESGLTFGVNPPIGVWSHLAIVRYNGVMTCYINGVQNGAPIADPRNYYHDTPGLLTIGADWNGTNCLQGRLDDVQIHARARWTGPFDPPSPLLVCPPPPAYLHAPFVSGGQDTIAPLAQHLVDGSPSFSSGGMLSEYSGGGQGIRFRPFVDEVLNAKILAANRAEGLNYRVDITPEMPFVFNSSTGRLFSLYDLYGYIGVAVGPSGAIRVVESDSLLAFSDEVTVSGFNWSSAHRAHIRYPLGSNYAQVYIDSTLVYTSPLNRRLGCGIAVGVTANTSINRFTFKDLIMEPV